MTTGAQRGPHAVERVMNRTMTTRDGKTLLSDVYCPVGAGDDLPTLVRRTPYGKNENDLALEFNEAHYFASHGYLVVVQNTRGRYGSEGKWYPFVYEAQDGYDAIEWAAALPGSSGRVGTFGQSYGALSQYLAASQRPPHLVTAVPVSAYLGAFENYWYNHGALELSWTLSYFMNMAADVLTARGDVERKEQLESLKVDSSVRFGPLTDESLRSLPIREWVERFGEGAPFLIDILHHSTDGPYWWAVDLRRQLQNMDIPILHIGSWYDIANWDTPQYFNGVSDQALTESSRSQQALFMGPWAHLLPFSQPTSGGTGDIDFGPEAAYPVLDMQRRWFDHYLREDGTEIPQARVTLFTMGTNTWREENEWPLARTIYTDYFLGSTLGANSSSGDGVLSTTTPATASPVDRFVYNPNDPVPTAGGRYVGGGVRDQSDNQKRHDVLVYTAPAQSEPLEATGPVSVALFASTGAVDTDFIAVLSDVHPDGFVQNLSEGLIRTRFRDSYDEPRLVQPGEVLELELELGNLSHVFLPGHSIRLHVTSSDFPRWDRNTNTGETFDLATSVVPARQTILHDDEHPSRLILPVIP